MTVKVNSISLVRAQYSNNLSVSKKLPILSQTNVLGDGNCAASGRLVSFGALNLRDAAVTVGNVIGKFFNALKKRHIEQFDLVEFKQFGKFEKGRAMLAGKGFSGEIFTQKARMFYNKGKLVQTIVPSGGMKKYFYNWQSGRLAQVNETTCKFDKKTYIFENGTLSFTNMLRSGVCGGTICDKTVISPHNRVLRTRSRFIIAANGQPIGEEITNLKTGTVRAIYYDKKGCPVHPFWRLLKDGGET